jgi:hypothetical protein
VAAQNENVTLQPLQFLDVSNVPSGNGLHFMSTLAVVSGNLNFLEGCFHAYTPYSQVRRWDRPGPALSASCQLVRRRFRSNGLAF